MMFPLLVHIGQKKESRLCVCKRLRRLIIRDLAEWWNGCSLFSNLKGLSNGGWLIKDRSDVAFEVIALDTKTVVEGILFDVTLQTQ
jgi:hypothetical protein